MSALLTALAAGGGRFVGDLIGGLTGASAAEKKAEAQRKAVEAAMVELDSVGIPKAEAFNVVYERLKEAGELTPEMQDYFANQSTELAKVAPDSEMRATRKNALGRYLDLSRTGLSTEEQAQRDQLMADAANVAASQGATAQANMAARGLGNSGMAVLNQQLAAQQGQNVAAQSARDLSTQASRRALEALAKGESLAANLEREDLSLDSEAARAADIINQSNTRSKQNVQQANVSARNEAARANLANRQKIMDANAGLTNQERDIVSRNMRQEFQDKNTRAASKAKLKLGLGDSNAAAAAAGANATGRILGGIGAAAGAGITQYETASAQQKAADNNDRLVSAQEKALQSMRTPEEEAEFDRKYLNKR